jgi:hypothetical protein
LSSALITGALLLPAQEVRDVEQLKRHLRELQESFEKAQREHKQQIESLTRQLDELSRRQMPGQPLPEAAELQRAQPPGAAQPAAPAPSGRWSPAEPLRLQSGGSFLDVSLVGTFAAGTSTADDIEGGTQLGGHDPNQRGFTVQGVELNLSGAVDPYFRGNANLSFFIDSGGETKLELEEAWLETMSLPANLQVRAGQLFTEFGRHNPTHPHAWAFVDQPLVLARFMGPDGLRNPGARLSWLTPTPFYSELFLNVQNSHGETATSFRSGGHAHGGEEEEEVPFAYRHPDNDRGMRGFDDLLFAPRYVASMDLTDNQVLLLGASAAFGPNASGEEGNTRTEIYGADVTWRWKSPRHHGGFPFVQFQTEALLRRYKAGEFDWAEEPEAVVDEGTGLPAFLEAEALTDYGLYTQLLYGFRKGWVAGLRGEFVTSDRAAYERMALTFDGEPLGRDPLRAQRWRLSPNLTWYPTEFSKLRLQYNYDNRLGIGEDHSVWLQFEFLIGAHAAHRF